jgi:hypothetical protein
LIYLLTTDRRIRYKNLAGRKIALVVLTGTTRWSSIKLHLEPIAKGWMQSRPGSYTEIEFPFCCMLACESEFRAVEGQKRGSTK